MSRTQPVRGRFSPSAGRTGALTREVFLKVNSTVKQILFWVLIIACLLVLWQLFQKNNVMGGHEQDINFSQFLSDVNSNQVSDVTITGPEVRGHFRADKGAFHVTIPANYSISTTSSTRTTSVSR